LVDVAYPSWWRKTDDDQHARKEVLSSQVGVDATHKHKFPARSIPPQVDMDRIDRQWADYGLA
jgi:hypothetical protein